MHTVLETPVKRSRSMADTSDAGLRAPLRHRECLTDVEAELFSILRRVLADAGLSTVVRVAGGWVRDKVCVARAYHERLRSLRGVGRLRSRHLLPFPLVGLPSLRPSLIHP